MRLDPCDESSTQNDIVRISVSSGETLAQWDSGTAIEVLQDDAADYFVDQMVVDHHSGNAVIIAFLYFDDRIDCKLIEFDEGGKMLKSYVLDEFLPGASIWWRHGPDDDRPARCLFHSEDNKLGMARWTPNPSITKVDHCLVIVRTSNNPIGLYRVSIFHQNVAPIDFTLSYE
jgi:hypothetical protein